MTTYNGPSDFVHLHCHTHFSPLDGCVTPDQYFEACAQRGWPAIAITEHGNLASVPDNYIASKKHGVKYIPGCEIYYNDYEPLRQQLLAEGKNIGEMGQADQEFKDNIRRNRHITVYAKNNKGLENLIKLTTQAWETGMYYKPRIWFEKLIEYREGLMIASGCLNGPISHQALKGNLKTDDKRGAIDYVEKFSEAFGEDFFLEVQMPCLEDKKDYKAFAIIMQIAKKRGIKAVLTNDCHYMDRRDSEVQKLMMAIDQNMTLDNPDLFYMNSPEQYLKTRAELYETFKTHEYHKFATDQDFEEICNNTLILANMCDKIQPDISPKVPIIPDAEKKLARRVMAALKKKKLDKCERKFLVDNREVTYYQQAQIELNRLIEKGFASYFLITADIVDFNIANKWPVGPRGSAGGSLVNYLLGISEIDPLLWGLSYNRFLSPARGGDILNIKAE